ncbi:MAG TPA: hypothetical protein VG322_13050 [Candidatus Acidoferrales bacterium]|nr:hypothetical protein [Candidatus Acidoferrales bacterium]
MALAWQIAFFMIARDPIRMRPMMLPSMAEKLLYPVATTVPHFQGRLYAAAWYVSLVDLVFLLLFYLSWRRTARS